MQWYRRVGFDCPTCGSKLMVQADQVRRREVVTCITCNTDLLLTPAGQATSQKTRERQTAQGGAPRDAVIVSLDL